MAATDWAPLATVGAGSVLAVLRSSRRWTMMVVAYLVAFSTAWAGASILGPSVWLVVLPTAIGAYLLARNETTNRTALFLLLACSLLVAVFSGPSGSGGRFHQWLIETLSLEPVVAETVVYWSRKTVHVCAYGSLAVLARCALPGHSVSRALTWVAGHAVADELTQARFVSRTGSAADVGLDLAGAVIALLVVPWGKRQ